MPLDPEVAAFLESQKNSPPRSSLTLEATRDMMRRNAALTGPAPSLAAVAELRLSETLNARQYWPARSAKGAAALRQGAKELDSPFGGALDTVPVWRAFPGSDTLPLIVYFHGGRFISGDLESHDALCRQLAQATHCRVLAVDYRLSPEHPFPAAAEDADAALAWAMDHSASTAVMGDSAGANLAAVAAIGQRGSAQLAAQVLVYPMIDATCSLASHRTFATGYGPTSQDMQRGWNEYLQAKADPRNPRVSPLYQDNLEHLPPTLVITAEYDTLRDEGEQYAQKLAAAGVSVTCHRSPGAIHGFFTMQAVLRLAREALQEAATFLRTHLNVTPRAAVSQGQATARGAPESS